jgi:hypothetical protein
MAVWQIFQFKQLQQKLIYFERLRKAYCKPVIKCFCICAIGDENRSGMPKILSIQRLRDRELVLRAAKLQKFAPLSLNQRPLFVE